MQKRYILRDAGTGRFYNHPVWVNDPGDAWSRDERDAFLFYSEEEVQKMFDRARNPEEQDGRFEGRELIEVVTVYSSRSTSGMGKNHG